MSEFAFSMPDGYRVAPRPRWGFGREPHARIASVLDRGRDGYARILDEIERHRPLLRRIAHDADPRESTAPFWNNIWFTALDAAALVALLLSRRPARLFEIGSGHSTMFAARAIRGGKLATTICSIDPQPRAGIDTLCQRTVRVALENCDLAIFDELEAGDFLFFDGSHRIFQNSDVTAFFLDVLPRLKPGILVHIHDIFLPFDYPNEWIMTLFSEQYLLAGMLLCGAPPFRVVLPNHFVCTDPDLGARVREIFRSPSGKDIPFHYVNPGNTPGTSFWIETVAS
jgi:predicted O-methyltransferase YrrM